MKNTKKRGFTIVELVIVIAVIAILASALIPTFASVVTNAKKTAALQEARNAYTDYLANYVTEHKGSLPGDLCIQSGEYYFEVKDGQFTGKECIVSSAAEEHSCCTIDDKGALVEPASTDPVKHTYTAPAGK